MNRLWIVFMLLLSLATAGSAQESSDIELYASSGFAIPSSPMTLANYWKMQYGGSVGVGFALSPSVKLLGSVEYYRFKLDEKKIGEVYDTEYTRDIWIFNDVFLTPSGDPSSVLTVSANIRVTPSPVSGLVSPYFMAGAGVMSLDLSEVTLQPTSVLTINNSDISMTAEQKILGGTRTSVFMQGGVGLDLNLSGMIKPFLEARYVFGFTKVVTTSYIPICVGVKVGL